MKNLSSIILTLIIVIGTWQQTKASVISKTASVAYECKTPSLLNGSPLISPREQSGIIAIEDDIYMVVRTQAFSITVKTVRIYTDGSKSNFVMGFEGCASTTCTYNLVIAGLATGTYFVEVETYSNTFFSNWITYE